MICRGVILFLTAAVVIAFVRAGSYAGVGRAQTSATGGEGTGAQQKDFEASLQHAQDLAQEQRLGEAIVEFKKAASIKHDDCSQCYEAISEIFLRVRRFKDSADAARKALAMKPPDEVTIQNLLGVALYRIGDKTSLEEAAQVFRRCIELDKGAKPEVYFNLGYALIKSDHIAEGRAALGDYLKRAPDGDYSYEARLVIDNPALVGSPLAHAFRSKTTTGQELSMDKLKGKIVLLDFWASWCGPCRMEMPAIKRLWEKYHHDSRFVMIGVSLDYDRQHLDAYVAAEHISWSQIWDRGQDGVLSRAYGVSAIPSTILIDGDGVVRGADLVGEELDAKVGDLLKAGKSVNSASAGK